ncbi:MAG: hypothetical protein H6745_27745 [Deltaproteobacteria bacterium]|nr:hypothetical protein [Deltaproteobacteria bacterium]
MEDPIDARRLLAYRARAFSRRFTGGSVVERVVAGGLLLVALAALGAGAVALAGSDLAVLDPAARAQGVRDRIFWFGTFAAVIFSYSTFEVFFRASDARLIGVLPVRGRTRYTDLFVRAVFLHLPLAFPFACYAVALVSAGAGALGTYAASMAGVLFVVGLPLCTWLHLVAGESLLSPSSPLRRQLAGAVFDDEAVLLVYAPAVGLLATLVLGLFAEVGLRQAVLERKGDLLAPVLGGAAAVAVASVIAGARVAERVLHRIMPRFTELDVPAPFRDDGVRKVVPGEWLAGRLPAAWRPYFLRDLRQLRRRHRVDRLLLIAYAIILVAFDLGQPAATWSAGAAHLVVLGGFVGLLVGSAFRSHGRELAAPGLEQTLPVEAGAARWGRVAADLLHPVVASVATGVAVAATGAIGVGLAVLGAGLALAVALVLVTQRVAAAAYPERVAAASLLFRAVILGLVGVASWQLG